MGLKNEYADYLLSTVPGAVETGRVNLAKMAALTADGFLPPLNDDIDESRFQSEINKLAQSCGWEWYHTLDSRGSPEGFPDSILIRDKRLVVAELKVWPNKPTDAQNRWLAKFVLVGAEVFVWYPEDWNKIQEVLK